MLYEVVEPGELTVQLAGLAQAAVGDAHDHPIAAGGLGREHVVDAVVQQRRLLWHQIPVIDALGEGPGRVIFVFDKRGVVRHVFDSQLNPTTHVDEAIGVLEALG